MAAEDWRAGHPLIRTLLREGRSFNFFQAVRLLQTLYPEASRVGEQGPPQQEAVRLTGTLSLDFPPGDLSGIEPERRAEGAPPRYVVAATFLGLYGVSSPIPTSYTEDLLDQEPDSLERGFYDLFQHRLLSLFYRSWERYRYPVRFQPDGADYYSRRLTRLLHVSRELVPPGHAVAPLRLLALAGLLRQEPRSAASLEAALATFFPETHFEVEPFVARWVRIPADQRFLLGVSCSTLGEDAHMGAAFLDRTSTFRLVVEAPDYARFLRFLPGGDLLAPCREVIDLMNTDFLDCQLEVRLAATAAAEPRLGAAGTCLGWSTWLGAPAPQERWVHILLQGALHGGR